MLRKRMVVRAKMRQGAPALLATESRTWLTSIGYSSTVEVARQLERRDLPAVNPFNQEVWASHPGRDGGGRRGCDRRCAARL
jgi:hypothetical protein